MGSSHLLTSKFFKIKIINEGLFAITNMCYILDSEETGSYEKKLTVIIMAVTMSVSLCACGSANISNKETSTVQNE